MSHKFIECKVAQYRPIFSRYILMIRTQFGLDSTVMTHHKTILTTSPYQLIAPGALSYCWRCDMHACACSRPRCSAEDATPAASLLIRTDRTRHLFLIRRDATDWPQLMFRARPTSSHVLSARLRPRRCHIADAAICVNGHIAVD